LLFLKVEIVSWKSSQQISSVGFANLSLQSQSIFIINLEAMVNTRFFATPNSLRSKVEKYSRREYAKLPIEFILENISSMMVLM
jgi:hypothetical protein